MINKNNLRYIKKRILKKRILGRAEEVVKKILNTTEEGLVFPKKGEVLVISGINPNGGLIAEKLTLFGGENG